MWNLRYPLVVGDCNRQKHVILKMYLKSCLFNKYQKSFRQGSLNQRDMVYNELLYQINVNSHPSIIAMYWKIFTL